MRYQGRITTWKDDKGFGFIVNRDGVPVFVHIKSFSNRQRRPTGNEIVTYEISVDDKGRAQAGAVAFVDEQAASFSSSSESNIPPLFACCFLIFNRRLGFHRQAAKSSSCAVFCRERRCFLRLCIR